MLDQNSWPDLKDTRMRDPLAKLEKSYIEAYLATKGYSLKDLPSLPKEKVKTLMTEACTYASSKLAEVETRSKLTHDLHGEK